MAIFTNPITVALAERAACTSRAAYFNRAADEVSVDWISKAYREKAEAYAARAGEISVALRTLSVGRLAA